MLHIDEISPRQLISRWNRQHRQHLACAQLNSAPRQGPWNCWSYFPGPARLLLACDARTRIVSLRSRQGELRRWHDPLAALAWLGEQMKERPRPGPPFKTGWVGHLSYDLGRLFERIPSQAADDLPFPLFELTYHDQVMAFDHAEGRAYDIRVASIFRPDHALRFIPRFHTGQGVVQPGFTRCAYEAAVQRAIDYIAAGDIFQVNLSQRFTTPLPHRPDIIYRRLRRRFPAWFGVCILRENRALLSNSPELFLRLAPDPATGQPRLITRPIKGTRPRSAGMDRELRDSIKDQAELNMIVDLERNDLGRICRIGSVRVTEPRAIEAHPTVYHGAATVEGILRDDVGLIDILRATFPGGSITGAPKIRAMEIIDELEPTRRGPYCGAIGFLSADGHMDLNIAIRTILVESDRAHVCVGGGIVADSTPAGEYEETLVKSRAMFAALGVDDLQGHHARDADACRGE